MDEMAKVPPTFLLALEMITFSVAEIKRGCKPDSTREEREYAKDALTWFNERLCTPCGYGWCLQVTKANPNAIRTKLIRIITGVKR